MSDFLAMGGYAGYVWSAFGLTLFLLGSLLWQSWYAGRKRARELETLERTLGTATEGRRGRPRAKVPCRVPEQPKTAG